MSQNGDENNQTVTSDTGVGEELNSNPFTSDLKGEFTSSFGTETNTMSQILSGGGLDSKRNKIIAGVAAAALALIVGFSLMSGSDVDDEFGLGEELLSETDDSFAGEEFGGGVEELSDDLLDDGVEVEEDLQAQAEAQDFDMAEGELATTDASEEMGGVAAGAAIEGLEGSELPVLQTPANGQVRSYDETSEYADFSWGGSPGGKVYFSRYPNMTPVEKSVSVSGNSYRLRHPWPGTWYWSVQNGAGMSEVASFSVEAAVRRNVFLEQPQPGSAISGNGGVVSWAGDTKVARYKVEISQSSWSQPDFKFQTSGNDLQLQGVAAGSYKLRLGAFSEVSGRWEYTQPVDVTIQ